MVTRDQVTSLLQQAQADLSAARAVAPGIAECHQRFWLQQSCEKAIKAYALMQWVWNDLPNGQDEIKQDANQPGEREKKKRQKFFSDHSPICTMRKNRYFNSNSLRRLTNKVETFIRQLEISDSNNVLHIDSQIATQDPNYVSYRYPFLRTGTYVAPVDYSASEWDVYQGGTVGKLSLSVQKLIQQVRGELRTWRP